MKKILKNQAVFGTIGIIIAVIIVVVGLAVFFMLRGEKKGGIKIGAVLPVSGPAKWAGIEIRDGMLLAVDRINSRNGINGRKIELIIEDSKTDPQEGRKAFNRIEKVHRPLFYVSVSTRF